MPDVIHHSDTSPGHDEQKIAHRALLDATSMSSNTDKVFDWFKDHSLEPTDYIGMPATSVPSRLTAEQTPVPAPAPTAPLIQHSGSASRKPTTTFPSSITSDSEPEVDFEPAPVWYSQDSNGSEFPDIESLSFNETTSSPDPVSESSQGTKPGQRGRGSGRGRGRSAGKGNSLRGRAKNVITSEEIQDAEKATARRSTRPRK